jgi:uncharacterized membrane protein YeaQ/YmgE (transglycosylase-associated protein family)
VTQLFLLLLVAIVVGFASRQFIRDSIPGGFPGSSIAALAGAWLGTLLFGSWGPDLLGMHVLPPVIGAAGFLLLLALLSKMTKTTV